MGAFLPAFGAMLSCLVIFLSWLAADWDFQAGLAVGALLYFVSAIGEALDC